jgi:LmbE family N-acetylglucosaminyl deacetylase
MKRWAVLGVLLSLAAVTPAQMRLAPVDLEQGHVGLGLALRRLANTGIFMHATAHPDDENNALLVLLSRGMGVRTVLASATRGNGGQNELGPEIGEALGVLRTEELAAMHRFDGAEQYFTRAVDFGYSFSIEETFEKWDRQEITSDFVRLIRTVRPDIVLSLRPEGAGGGQHHEASAVIVRDAFKLAADPQAFPEQLRQDGLSPWQPRKLYIPAQAMGGRGAAPTTAGPSMSINLAAYAALLGRTFAEVGSEARSMHKSQGMSQLLALPAPSVSTFQLTASALPGGLDRPDRGLFDGIDYSLAGLAQFAAPKPPRELTNGLSAISSAVQDAQKRFDAAAPGNEDSTLQPLLTGLRLTRELRGQLRAIPITDAARFEIDFRLRQKEREFQQAVLLASSIRVEALADDGVVVAGQPVRVTMVIANRGAANVGIREIGFEGFSGDGACTLTAATGGGGRGGPASGAASSPLVEGPPLTGLAKDQVGRCDVGFTIPADARVSEPYWRRDGEAGRYVFDEDAPFGLPQRPSPFYAHATLSFGPGMPEVFAAVPVQYRYEGDVLSGEKRSPLLVVPPLSVRVSPGVAIVPSTPPSAAPPPATQTGARGRGAAPAPTAGRGGRGAAAQTAKPVPTTGENPEAREIRVTVVNTSKGAAEGVVALELPDGWTAVPPEQPVTFGREDEAQAVRFQLRTPQSLAAGELTVRARATVGEQTIDRGFQVIEYPHTSRQHVYHPAQSRVKVMDVKATPDLTVGYITGAGDDVASAIEQLGARVEFLDEDDLAWSDLSRFPVIVTGVRAYERRADLRAHNSRLLDYVRSGGRLIVQYNRLEFNQAEYAPHGARVTQNRVTDEAASVSVLVPTDPLFTTPNRIDDAAWAGWVQERGLYFLGELDSRYRDLVEMEDSYPNNPEPKRGALVVANYGKGRWVYVGLALWRQLPAGVDGAYSLLANLISPK